MLQFIIFMAFIGLAAGLAWFLISQDRGEKEPVDALWLAVGFGIAGALLAGFIEGRLIESDNLLPGMTAGTILKAALGVGVIEESIKFLPLAFFIYKRRYFNEHTDGVIYFALAGLGFGLPENILYTLQFGAKTGLLRLFLTPLFHAAATAGVGYFLIRRKLSHKSSWSVLMALLVVITLHGFYDFGLAATSSVLNTLAIVVTLCMNAGLFLLYMRATDKDQESGKSAVGHNSFCRSCGWANPNHNLYCVHCGKNA